MKYLLWAITLFIVGACSCKGKHVVGNCFINSKYSNEILRITKSGEHSVTFEDSVKTYLVSKDYGSELFHFKQVDCPKVITNDF